MSDAAELALTWKQPFSEQVDYFRSKLNLPSERWDDIRGAAHDRAFMVAGVTKADMLQDFHDAVDRAIAKGGGLQAFRRDFAQIVQRYGWDYNGSFDWRSRVIYQTNLASSYAAGRWAQLTDPAFAKAWPYWRYVHADGVANPRPLHVSWHGITLPMTDKWWRTHFGPNGWGCHCRVVAVSKRDFEATAESLRQTPDDGSYTHVDAFGESHEVPNGIDYGWSHAPGAAVDQTFSQLVADKLIRWDARIGASAFAEMREALVPALTQEFSAWADALTQERGQVRVVGALSPQVTQALAERGIAPQSAHLAVRDSDVLHTHRDSKDARLPWEWYRQLPDHLSKPAAVLLDKTSSEPALLYAFDIEGEAAKMVARLDYQVAVRDATGKRTRAPFNVLRTGRLLPSDALLDQTAYELLEGAVK